MTYDALVVGAGQMLFLRPMTGLPVGAVHYTAWYDDMGKILDDGRCFAWASTNTGSVARSATFRGCSIAPRV